MAEPKIRFKKDDGTDFPKYQRMKMSDIFTEIIDKNHPDMPVLSILQGTGTVLRDESGRNIGYDRTNLNGYKAMQKGDFIIHLRSFEGGLECSNHDGISSPAYRILRTDILLPEAYRSYFRTYNFIEGKLAIAVVGIRDGKNIDMPTFWEIEMDIPSIEEQQKIASFFSDLDEVISASEAEVAALEKQKKGAMQKIFSQEVRFKKDDGSDYPEWEEYVIGDIIELYDERVDSTCELPILTSSKQDGVVYQSDHFGREQLHNIDGYSVLPYGYCTYRNRSDGTDFKFNINYLCEAGIVSKFYPVFTSKDCNLFFLMTLLNNEPETIKRIAFMAVGTGQKVLSISALLKMKVAMPCLEEQQKIADFLSDFDTAIDLAKQELEKWKLLKKGLLQQMFV